MNSSTQDSQIQQLINLKDAGILEFNQVETKVTKTLLEFIEAVNKILRDSESERSTDKMEILVREVLKLQNTFISLNSQDQWNTEQIIKTMKPQLEASFGCTMSQEICDMLASMTVLFEESFNQLRSHLDKLKDNLVNAKYEALKIQHELELNQFKVQAAQDLAEMKQSYESQIQQLSNQLTQGQSSANSQVAATIQKDSIPANPTPPVIEEPIFDNSDCSNDPQEKAYFQEIMGNKKFKTVLRYKASRDGWMIEDWHRLVDGIARTVSLFKIKENTHCVGGFTTSQWASPEFPKEVKDSTAMLFNLTTHKLFKCNINDEAIICNEAIICSKKWGPFFGQNELRANEPFNGNKNCWSIANQESYCIEEDTEKINKLTNLKQEVIGYSYPKSSFTTTEFEVWEVIFSE